MFSSQSNPENSNSKTDLSIQIPNYLYVTQNFIPGIQDLFESPSVVQLTFSESWQNTFCCTSLASTSVSIQPVAHHSTINGKWVNSSSEKRYKSNLFISGFSMSQPCLYVCVLLNCFQNYAEMKSLPGLCPETIFLWMKHLCSVLESQGGGWAGWRPHKVQDYDTSIQLHCMVEFRQLEQTVKVTNVVIFCERSYVSDNCWLFLYYNRPWSFPYFNQVLPVLKHIQKIFTWTDGVLQENKRNTWSADTSLIRSTVNIFCDLLSE